MHFDKVTLFVLFKYANLLEVEESSTLGYETVLLGGRFPLLQTTVMPPSSGSGSPRRDSFWTARH